MKTHSLTRTSPKGEKFIGTCVLCGMKNLPIKSALMWCENIVGKTNEEAIIDAIVGYKI